MSRADVRIPLSRDTVQHLLHQIGLPDVVLDEGEIVAVVQEEETRVLIALAVPVRPARQSLAFLRRDPPRGRRV